MWLASGAAEARIVRAASRGEAVAVLLAIPEGSSRPGLWRALDGVTFEPVAHEPGRWILDLWILPDGAVVLATSPIPREGPVTIERISAGGGVQLSELAGSSTLQEGIFIEGPGGLALAAPGGIWRSRDGGRTFDRAGDPRTLDPASDFYGHDITSGRITAAGRVDLVVPSFDTCGSFDHLEGVRRVTVTPSGRQRFRDLPLDAEVPVLGPDSLIRVRTSRGGCLVTTDRGAALRLTSTGGSCRLTAAAGRRSVALVVGDTVVAQRGRSLRSLGRLPDPRALAAVHPDAAGGVIVLLADHRLLRHAPGRRPTLVWSGP